MPLVITTRTAIATYHHARQSDIHPTPQELQGWVEILNANYERILPEEMARKGLNPSNQSAADLALLLAELTENSSIRAKAIRGCAVLAGLQRAGFPDTDATPPPGDNIGALVARVARIESELAKFSTASVTVVSARTRKPRARSRKGAGRSAKSAG